jgi:hypothetical protein
MNIPVIIKGFMTIYVYETPPAIFFTTKVWNEVVGHSFFVIVPYHILSFHGT